ncbi:unnamed protein product [Protopolystoma xenopodis]|uniref:Uncharacterized protein n=1 Tax=Protopolystoma xenopodis TaxID=117903 RepID=A0A3S4ZEV3_9PLAT|nr:unnamed protein product [Protopolystoma xenopodis]
MALNCILTHVVWVQKQIGSLVIAQPRRLLASWEVRLSGHNRQLQLHIYSENLFELPDLTGWLALNCLMRYTREVSGRFQRRL